MANILFTHSYFLRLDPKQWANQQPYPPLGTLYAASLMRREGHNVSLCDSMLSEGPDHIRPALESRPDYLVIYDDGFNYLTKMCLTNMREAAFEMARLARNKGIKVICCSSDSTDHYKLYLDKGMDYIITGEGEVTLHELIKNLEEGRDVSQLEGIVYKKSGEYFKNPNRPVLKELDDLPQPAWDLVDMEAYRSVWDSAHGYFSLNYATTRGCPFKCNWCAKPIYGNRYNSHSPERVARDLLYLKSTHDFDHIWFCDDIFGLKPGWVQVFSEWCSKLDLEFSFKIQSRADLLLKEDTIEALAKAGADEIWIGAESGSQRILDAMDKGTTVEQIRQSTLLMKEHGIKPCYFLQFGYLDETLEDIQLTIELMLDQMPYDIGVSVSYPLPGTKFFDLVKEDLSGKANWTDSDDLALMFRNSYSPQYYRKLQRYVHKLFRRKQGWQTIKQLILQKRKISLPGIRSAILTFYYAFSIPFDKMYLKYLQSR